MTTVLPASDAPIADWVNTLCAPPWADQRPLLTAALERLDALSSSAESPRQRPQWLTAALTQIAEDIQTFTPPKHPPLAWHVLFITHRLMCAQETAYQTALQRKPYPACPMHPSSPVAPRHRRAQVTVPLSGLGLLFAGYWLPPESQSLFHEARDAGIDGYQVDAWAHPPLPTHPPTVESPQSAQTRTPPTPPALTTPAADQPASPSDTQTALHRALIDSVRHLCAHPPCNRNGSAAWVTVDTVWVIARLLAEQMIAHPALHPHTHLKQRTVLYRALVSHGLTQSDGKRPIWKITLRFGAHHQRADTLRIACHLIWPDGDAPPAISTQSVSLDR